MLQLSLQFLERQIDRFKTEPPRKPEPGEPWLWKHGLQVHLVRQPRARRYLLRLEADGVARLVIPRRGSQAEGLRFLERSEAWLLKQWALWQNRSQTRLPWTAGTRFLFRGNEVTLGFSNSGGKLQLEFADQVIPLTNALPDYRDAVRRHLRRIAERELPLRTNELALVHDVAIKRVTVRAQKTRWGSCSARGTISLNWRLIQAPSSVVDYLIIHELMHRREMNHSTRYWKLVAAACPDYRTSELWLKKNRLEMA
jgi:predicted metal-dependent hydrolase